MNSDERYKYCFVKIRKKITGKRTRTCRLYNFKPIFFSFLVHEGVALIFEMPHNGRVAKPKASSTIAIAIKIISSVASFSRNLRYKTAVITPIIVIDELDALPRPNDLINCLKEPVN